MSLFLLFILSIYSAVHLYAFLRIRAAFPFGTMVGILLGLFMAAMVFSPVAVRILERYGHDYPARLLSYLGYGWMGVLFLFFSISVMLDLWRMCAALAGFMLRKDLAVLVPGSRIAFIIPLILALVLAVYGYFSALNIRTETITMKTPKIPASLGGIRIVQISDVHLGIIVRKERLTRILSAIRQAEPDILVSTGDLVDGQIDNLSDLADVFNEVSAPYGKYAVTGNHEFYAGLDQALEITRRAGFRVLRNEAASGVITIAGVDDPTVRQFGLSRGIPEERLLAAVPKDRFTVLLKHQPIIRDGSLGLYDLQLSGHTHKGQIFPFRYLVRIFFSHLGGWYDLTQGSHLYVSRGTGTWGPPVRVLSPPEITVIDIVHGR